MTAPSLRRTWSATIRRPASASSRRSASLIRRSCGSADAKVGDVATIADGQGHEVVLEIVAKQEFAGYWEYMLDEAIFTAPFHPQWGGAALLDEKDALIGMGSLRLQMLHAGDTVDINMSVPIDLLKPILDDMVTTGSAARDPRPWLGVFT